MQNTSRMMDNQSRDNGTGNTTFGNSPSNTSIGLILLDEDGHVVHISAAAESLSHHPPGSVIGKHIDTIIPGIFAGRMHPCTPGQVEIDGASGRLLVVYEPLLHNAIAGVLLLRDLSREAGLTQEVEGLRESVRDLEGILDAIPDEVFVTDGEGTTLRVSSATQQLCGLPASALIGKNVKDLETEGVFSPSITPLVLRAKKRVTEIQETKTGRRVMAIANPIFNDDGQIVRIVTLSRDITEFYDLKKKLTEKDDLIQRYINEVTALRQESTYVDTLIVKSPSMRNVIETSRRVAGFDSTVLLLGESGTGKDTLAKIIHQSSPRNTGPFIKVSCGAIPEALMESEFFGYVPGAFTGAHRSGKRGMAELADRGTLFLNEVDCLPLSLQVKILQLIQEKRFMQVGGTKPISVNIRIIAASNRVLSDLVKEGRFREDLYYRLNVVPVVIPPLRKRKEEIAPLAALFLERLCKQYGVRKKLSPEIMNLLTHYHWPGNVRELEHLIERCVVTSRGPLIVPSDLPPEFHESSVSEEENPGSVPATGREKVRSLKSLESIEKEILQDALWKYGSTRKVAAHLGLSQSTVMRRLKKYGLRSPCNPRR